jgi:hypothetical protein
MGAVSKIVEPKFSLHSSSGTFMCICFNQSRPENHQITTALQDQVKFELNLWWNHVVHLVYLFTVSVLSFKSRKMARYWVRNVDLKSDCQLCSCLFLGCWFELIEIRVRFGLCIVRRVDWHARFPNLGNLFIIDEEHDTVAKNPRTLPRNCVLIVFCRFLAWSHYSIPM